MRMIFKLIKWGIIAGIVYYLFQQLDILTQRQILLSLRGVKEWFPTGNRFIIGVGFGLLAGFWGSSDFKGDHKTMIIIMSAATLGLVGIIFGLSMIYYKKNNP